MRRWRTALVGFGKIAQGYADDAIMAKHYDYATHAQVLRDHPAIDWLGVVDPDPEARSAAKNKWHVPHVEETLQGLPFRPEIIVLAGPPANRLQALDNPSGLRAVVIEKPLAENLADAHAIQRLLSGHEVLAQVNLWRRCDPSLAPYRDNGALLGSIQCASGIYGNGWRNNGTHLVDLIRMLCGEIDGLMTLAAVPGQTILPGDMNLAVDLHLQGGAWVSMRPLNFSHYREVGIDIWGESARLEIWNEGLVQRLALAATNRAMKNEREMPSDSVRRLEPGAGVALYSLYQNLIDALEGKTVLQSPLDSALRTMQIVEAAASSPLLTYTPV